MNSSSDKTRENSDKLKQSHPRDFKISPAAVVGNEAPSFESGNSRSLIDFDNLGELSRAMLETGLYAMARDPYTLFVYWEIDWPRKFGDAPPANRLVHLRVLSEQGEEESSTAVEPLIRSCFLPVGKAGTAYRLEIGFFSSPDVWNSVETSALVTTPPDDLQPPAVFTVASVPFHLSFQRLVEMSASLPGDGEKLVQKIAALQERADELANGESLTDAELNLLHAIATSVSKTEGKERSELRFAPDLFATSEDIEAILGSGATSPTGSSRS